VLEWWLSWVGRVRNGYHIPMGPEMLAKNRIIGFADLSALEVEGGHCRSQRSVKYAALTINLRSFEKVNLRTASMRSNESSESLMLFIGTRQPLILLQGFPDSAYNRVLNSRSEEVWTIQVVPIFLRTTHMRTRSEDWLLGRNRNTQGSGWALAETREEITSCKVNKCSTQRRGLSRINETHIEAMSLIPMHLRTSWTIILSFPLSPVSPESGTEMGGPSSTAFGVASCFRTDNIIDSS
jgi:hypothetical protein